MSVNKILQTVQSVASQGPFQPTWESLTRFTVPEWYRDAKFGIFIHWGLYSVPAYGNEWYPRNMYLQDSDVFKHHIETYGPQDKFGYKDFIPRFTAEKFSAAEWVGLFKEAGARYVVPVAEHHDGYPMYATALSKWNAPNLEPGRDIIAILADECRRQDLVFGLSSHRAEHWWFMNGGRKFPSDVQDEHYRDFYGPAAPDPGRETETDWRNLDWTPRPDAAYLDDWLARCAELVDRYNPQLFWFDWWIEQAVFAPYIQKFAAYYYNRSAEWEKGVAINYKNRAFPPEAAVFDVERGKLPGINPYFWQTDTSVSYKSWGYIENDEFKPVRGLVHDLVDIVSKNGCLLLNVGPRADGTIPEGAVGCLRGIGEWLRVNGEAIYGTRPWKVYGEGDTPIPESFKEKDQAAYTAEDIRYTRKGRALYAISLGWPEEEWHLKSLNSERINSVSLLGSNEILTTIHGKDGLHVWQPGKKPCDHAYTLKIILE